MVTAAKIYPTENVVCDKEWGIVTILASVLQRVRGFTKGSRYLVVPRAVIDTRRSGKPSCDEFNSATRRRAEMAHERRLESLVVDYKNATGQGGSLRTRRAHTLGRWLVPGAVVAAVRKRSFDDSLLCATTSDGDGSRLKERERY
jgi:hypothetical protein